MTELWRRELIFSRTVNHRPQPNYAIVWEDPEDLDAPAKITVPSPIWLGMAMYGGILPPVDVYHRMAEDESRNGFYGHGHCDYLHSAPPITAMTEEQAMEYLVQKDIPTRVWRDYRGNRELLRIVRRDHLPSNRKTRNAWRLSA